MTLGIFLAMGDSFDDMKKSGQDIRFKKFYLSSFAKSFTKVYVFSYANEVVGDLPKNVILVPNKFNLHRYLYALLLPFFNFSKVINCDMMRVYHLSGTPSAIVAKFLCGKPFIFNYAYDYQKFAQVEKKYLQLYLIKILEPMSIFFSKKIFAANRSIFEKLPRNKAVYLPNGVDTNFFKPAKVRKISKRPRILSVGRLEKQKNFEILIKALSGMDVDLTIVGNGSLRNKLQNLAKKQKVNLKIISNVPNTQMPKIYNQADIFVLPSFVEGSPKALLEAMACGLLVIASDINEIQEIIIHNYNGIIRKPYSRYIRAALKETIASKSKLEKLSQKARKTAMDNFNLNILFQKEITYLQKM